MGRRSGRAESLSTLNDAETAALASALFEGSLDPSFGSGDGKVTTSLATGYVTIRGAALQ